MKMRFIIDFSLGTLNEDYLRELLTTLGDRFTQDEVDDLYKEAPIKNGQFDYVEFTRILKHGAKDPDDKWPIQNMKNTRSRNLCIARPLMYNYLLTPIQILAFYFCPHLPNQCMQSTYYIVYYVFMCILVCKGPFFRASSCRRSVLATLHF